MLAAARHEKSSPLISAQEKTQSDVKGQVNPSQVSGDRLHFPSSSRNSQVTEPKCQIWKVTIGAKKRTKCFFGRFRCMSHVYFCFFFLLFSTLLTCLLARAREGESRTSPRDERQGFQFKTFVQRETDCSQKQMITREICFLTESCSFRIWLRGSKKTSRKHSKIEFDKLPSQHFKGFWLAAQTAPTFISHVSLQVAEKWSRC